MWIRSQDKEKLADLRVFDISKTNYVNLPYKVCGYSDDWANTNNFHIDLGHYSTKEKALKVLDMIEIHLQKLRNGDLLMGKLFDQKKYVVTEYMRSSVKEAGFVFQMPQYDEV